LSSFILNSLRNGAIYRKKGVFLEKINPLVKLSIVMSYIIASLLLDLIQSVLMFIFTIIFLMLCSRKLEIIYLTRFLFIIAFLSAFFVGLFYSWIRTLTVFLRILIIGMWVSMFIATTDPDELSKFLELIGLPTRLSIILPLSLKLIPVVANDTEETLISLYFKGEFGENRLNPGEYIKPLTVLIASSIWRVKFIAESLAHRGVLRGRKTFYLERKIIEPKDILFSLCAIFILAVIILNPIDIIYQYLQQLIQLFSS